MKTGTARFSPRDLAAIDAIKYLYVRAGATHRFIAIWAVVVDGRLLARSWNDKPTGWQRAFLREKRGAIRVGEREVPVEAARVRSRSLIDGADAAYARKYTTPASRQYVRGLATEARRATTLELRPAARGRGGRKS